MTVGVNSRTTVVTRYPTSFVDRQLFPLR